MLRAGIPQEKLLVLHNGVDNSDMLPRLGKSAARQALGLDTKLPYVVYTGNMQPNKCIESIIDMAALLPKVRFLLVGGRPEDLERLRAYAQSLKADNVDLVERRPIAEVSSYLYAADVLVIPPVSAPLEKFGKTVLPFKLFPYLAAGKPILAPDQPDMRELLVNGENGMLVPPDDAPGNSVLLESLLNDAALQARLSSMALETSEALTWESRATKFKNWLIRRWGRD
jgi:glycosyltransferase involved in cell wall biosynthesis